MVCWNITSGCMRSKWICLAIIYTAWYLTGMQFPPGSSTVPWKVTCNLITDDDSESIQSHTHLILEYKSTNLTFMSRNHNKLTVTHAFMKTHHSPSKTGTQDSLGVHPWRSSRTLVSVQPGAGSPIWILLVADGHFIHNNHLITLCLQWSLGHDGVFIRPVQLICAGMVSPMSIMPFFQISLLKGPLEK